MHSIFLIPFLYIFRGTVKLEVLTLFAYEKIFLTFIVDLYTSMHTHIYICWIDTYKISDLWQLIMISCENTYLG